MLFGDAAFIHTILDNMHFGNVPQLQSFLTEAPNRFPRDCCHIRRPSTESSLVIEKEPRPCLTRPAAIFSGLPSP